MIRLASFWSIIAGTAYVTSLKFPILDFPLIGETIGNAFATGHLEGLSSPGFAFALASMIGAVALGLAIAYFIMHVVLISLAISDASRRITRAKNSALFAENFDAIDQRLSKHPLIGHAWRVFDQTMVRIPGARIIQTTVRPGSLLNFSAARERLAGLKMMGSIPGYFVGVGLLLTFMGLVLALQQASAAVSSNDANGMQTATRQLLKVATFKFTTSIAGLGSSIVLSIFFRFYTVLIEAAFDRLNHQIEQRVRIVSSQSIAWSMNESLSAQLTELKQINSADFFARMGEKISPQIHSAFTTAMAPVTASIDNAMARLSDSSQSGVSELIKEFSQTLQVGAGEELRELTKTLQTMQGALVEAQGGIGRTGEDFGRRMTEAAENLNRLVSDAGGRMNESSEQSRKALMDVVGALRETFERANQKIDEQLGQAASGVSSKIEDAMVRVMGKLEGQVESFRGGLDSYHQDMSKRLNETNAMVGTAQAGAVSAVAAASSEAANALKDGLAVAMQSIRTEIETFASTIRSVELGMTSQVTALRDATEQTRLAADAFGATAQDVRSASAPLLQSSERIAGATHSLTTAVSGASERISVSVADANSKLAESLTRSVASFEAGQRSAAEFAGALGGHISQLSTVWTGYSEKFERVDEELGSAIDDLSEAVSTQGQQLVSYASKVDESFATAISRLNPFLEELKSNTEDLGESVSELKVALRVPARA
ncbi:anti-phage ZorAB system protein ZorA [Bradyrhizobium sp. SZCCHNR2012]|uniref:anti-phage ZorAB system protein ZorA n=1 Tax=Bradyrhizobium sp. SZCCHNR2012 TaxID=3057377 RepID=UPI0028E55413|nr:anti-phage ZorAB system protein ZorA [Bradyrhizobium sp. SZCCHNR2012]